MEILREGVRVHPDDAILHYGLACVHAVNGHRDEALESLGKAIELKPEAREWAREDTDFESLREDERFRSMLGA